MNNAFKDSIKNLFVLIGVGSISYCAITFLPLYYEREKFQSSCADTFGLFEYRWVDGKLYCKTISEKWIRHPNPPQRTEYNVWGQEISK